MPTLNASTHGEYATNTSGGTLNHNQPVKQGNWVGIAIKQKAISWKTGWSAVATIANGEDFFIQTEGTVLVPNTGVGMSAAVRGDAVYVTTGNVLTTTVGTNTLFGRLSDQAGQRGCPTGFCRVTLDRKDI